MSRTPSPRDGSEAKNCHADADVAHAVHVATPLTGPRTLPVGIRPLPGETLDSWLAALARHLDLQWGSFLSLVLVPENRTGRRQITQRDLTAHLTVSELQAISAATGIDADTIAALMLPGCAAAPTSLGAARRRTRTAWPFGRSRFCPGCLQSTQGRWQLQWRLPWVFSCAAHSCLLADPCPACGQHQRVHGHWLRGKSVPTPELCSAPTPDGQCCGAPLAEATTIPLPAGHPLLRRQAQLSEILTGTTVAFGVYQTMPTSTPQFIADLRLLAFRTAEVVDAENLLLTMQSPLSDTILAAWDSDEVRQWRAVPDTPRTPPALITAMGISSALAVLECPALDEAAARLRPFLTKRRVTSRQVNTDALNTMGHNPVVDAVTIRALTTSMSPINQLRFRACTPVPRSPRNTSAVAMRNVPTCLWSDWAIRIRPLRNHKQPRPTALTRVPLSMLLLTVGNQVAEAEFARGLGMGTFGVYWARNRCCFSAARLNRQPLWTNIATALTRLSDHLAEQPSPIDYARRRRLNYRNLLPHNEWVTIFEATDFGDLDCADTGQLIRTWLYQRISMLPPEMAPFTAAIGQPDGRHRAVVELLARPITDQLDAVASRFLEQYKIFGEPIYWSPPLELVADLELPGPDVDQLCVDDLHQALLDGWMSIEDAARTVGVEPLVIRHLLERSPLPRPMVRRKRQWARNQTRLHFARQQLTCEELTRLHKRQKWTMYAIGRHFGIDSKVVKALALEYGIDVAMGNTPARPLTAEWLRQQYVVDQRSLTDIERETGVSRSTIKRRLIALGLPVRSNQAAPAVSITAEWLHDQYVVKRRPLKIIATEAGVSYGLLRAKANQWGIPVSRTHRADAITPEWIRKEHVVNRRTLADMAQEVGVDYRALSRKAKQWGIPVRRSPHSNVRMPITAEWIYQEHVGNRRTLADMANEAGVQYNTLSLKAKQWGIPVRRGLPFNPTLAITADWIYREHVVNGRTLTDMAKEAGVSDATLGLRAKQWGIPVRSGARRGPGAGASGLTPTV
ncbi:MAG: TniQ family protein [Actinobacteria bacterium]|nr:TniQ family protein [Actinomycetota bacterium]